MLFNGRIFEKCCLKIELKLGDYASFEYKCEVGNGLNNGICGICYRWRSFNSAKIGSDTTLVASEPVIKTIDSRGSYRDFRLSCSLCRAQPMLDVF